MSIDDTDVTARLRAGADSMTGRNFDTHEVLEGSKHALRRRRSWQAIAAGTTVVATLALALAGPVPVPGIGELALPGSKQIRSLFGLETEPAACVVEDLTVEWGEVSSRTEAVLFVASVSTDDGIQEGTIEDGSLPEARVAAPLLLPEVARALPTLAEHDRAFTFVAQIDDGYDRYTAAQGNLPPSGYAWWTTSELRSLPGVVRCGGLPVTFDGDRSAEFTITSWNGEDASGYVPCINPPSGLSQVEREAVGYCEYFD
ncbi:hypothetical protein AB1046_17010 [Promicromonospora sp. Populi]|uniref:hypothetical protein n=1 Tax=Promicromonospora sp. Populi TaxID=3239420 RepID=UPI0034E1B572